MMAREMTESTEFAVLPWAGYVGDKTNVGLRVVVVVVVVVVVLCSRVESERVNPLCFCMCLSYYTTSAH